MGIIGNLLKQNKILLLTIKEQQNELEELSKRLDIYEDSYKDIFLDCNVIVRNGKKNLLNMGKCSLQFFPRNIYFRIECKGDLLNDDKNKRQKETNIVWVPKRSLQRKKTVSTPT